MAKKGSVYIPIDFWRSRGLSWEEKILLVEIEALAKVGDACAFSDAYISEILGCSIASAKRAVAGLIDKGYIRPLEGRKRVVESCGMVDIDFDMQNLCEILGKKEDTPLNTLSPLSSSLSPTTPITSSIPVYSLNTQKKQDIAHAREGLVLPFSSDEFREVWETLIDQPKWRKKTASALQLSLNKLGKYAEPFAIQLMNDSIERGWIGVVFDNTDARYEAWTKANKSAKKEYPDGYYYRKDFSEEEIKQLFGFELDIRKKLYRGESIRRKNGKWEI